MNTDKQSVCRDRYCRKGHGHRRVGNRAPQEIGPAYEFEQKASRHTQRLVSKTQNQRIPTRADAGLSLKPREPTGCKCSRLGLHHAGLQVSVINPKRQAYHFAQAKFTTEPKRMPIDARLLAELAA